MESNHHYRVRSPEYYPLYYTRICWQRVMVTLHLTKGISNSMKYKSLLCSCLTCHKSLSVKGIHSHFLAMHSSSADRHRILNGAAQGSTNGNLVIQAKKLNATLLYKQAPNLCLQCDTPIDYDKRKNKFCSHSCAAINTNVKRDPPTATTKAKTSATLKGRSSPNKGRKLVNEYTPIRLKACTCCNNSFWSVRGKVCCSPECARTNQTYRKIVHLYKHNDKILKLESSWEVSIATWLDANSIQWIRPKHLPWTDSTGKQRKYFPDFYLSAHNLYLDPKNKYQISISMDKLDAIQSRYNLIYGDVSFIKTHIQALLDLN